MKRDIANHLVFLLVMCSLTCAVFTVGRAVTTAVDMQVLLFVVWSIVFGDWHAGFFTGGVLKIVISINLTKK